MISRRSTKLIADAYSDHFKHPLLETNAWALGPKVYKLKDEEVYNFLYVREYEVAFLQVMASYIYGQTTQKLIMAIRGIHTGETLVPATTQLNYQQRQQMGQALLKRLAEDIIRHYEVTPVRQIDYTKIRNEKDLQLMERVIRLERPAEPILNELTASLEMDGYIYQEGHLYPTESALIDTIEQRTALEKVVDSVAIKEKHVIKHHIQESEKAYAEQKWGHSISDARNVLEAILREIAAAHYLKTKGQSIPDSIYKWPVKVREYLLMQSLIDKSEQEALAKIYGLLSSTGSHPNIAEQDQARLMRYLSLSCSQYVLLQWQGYLVNNF